MNQGLELLSSKPFTGEWAFQLGESGDSGLYMHNALDVWAQAGIVPFLMFVSIWLFTLAGLYVAFKRAPRIARETVPVLMFAALSWALSRNIGFVVLFFCLGYSAAAFGRVRAIRRRRVR